MLPGVGKALQAAFPVVGAVAFAGVLGEVGSKVKDFFKTLHDAPEKAAGQWSALTQSLRLSNAELELTNAKLEQDISKLEGKPHNGLTVMLEEARVAALNLGAQLDKDIQGMYKLFKEQDAGFFGRLFGGADNRELEKLLGGETSYGGLNAQLRKVNEDEDRQLEAVDLKAKNAKEQIKAITDAAIAARKALLETINKAIDPKLSEANRLAVDHKEIRTFKTGDYGIPVAMSVDVAGNSQAKADVEVLSKAKADAAELIRHMNDVSRNSTLTGRKEDLQAGSAQVKKDQEELNRLNQELVSLQDKHLEGLDKIAAEERAEIQRLTLAKSINESTLAVVRMISEAKLINFSKETSDKFYKMTQENLKFWAKQVEEFGKRADAAYKAWTEPAIKNLEKISQALHKLNTEYLATVASASRQNVSHQVAMIGIEGQRSDPIGTLERQQAVEKAAIQAHYNAQLEEANKTLKDAELILTRRNLAAQKNLELDRLDYELAQKKASDTSSISGNLAAGKRNAESPSEIANGVINSAGDRMADQFRVWRSRASRPGMRP
jgi:hypothetical protein